MITINRVFNAIRRDYRRLVKRVGITIDISFKTPVGDSGGWGGTFENGGYANVKCLNDIVDDLNIKKYAYAEVQGGKNLFFIPLEYDLEGKKEIKVIWNNNVYRIRKAIPHQPLGDGFLCQLLIQE